MTDYDQLPCSATGDDQDDWMIYLQIVDHRCKGKLNMARTRCGHNLYTDLAPCMCFALLLRLLLFVIASLRYNVYSYRSKR